ncbi:MAG: hypothetical protein ACKO3N_04230 [Verrucomicrobiota bacterium]
MENIDRLGQVFGAQYKIAHRLGVDHKTVIRWTSDSVPTLGSLIRIVAVWDVEPRDLLVGTVDWRDGVGQPEIRFEPQRVTSIDDRMERLASLFEKEMHRPLNQHCASLKAVCKAVGTTLATVRHHRPDLAASLVARAKNRRTSVIAHAKNAALKRCREVIHGMQREERPVSRYYVWRELEAMREPHLRQVLAQFPVVMREQGMV